VRKDDWQLLTNYGSCRFSSEHAYLHSCFINFIYEKLARHQLPMKTHNPAVDPVPFGHWTLRDEAA